MGKIDDIDPQRVVAGAIAAATDGSYPSADVAAPAIPVPLPGRSIVAAFERAVDSFSNRIALETVGERLTYGELNTLANRLAWRLLDAKGGQGSRVALLLPEEASAFYAFIATLKAGRIAVVLNLIDPQARHVQLVRDAEPTVILTNRRYLDQARAVALEQAEVICVDDRPHALQESNPDSASALDDAVCLTYTSGTTGRPKGVIKTNRLFLHYSGVARLGMSLTEQDRVILLPSLSGGQAQGTMWTTLTTGATLMSFPAAVNGVTGLSRWLTEKNVSVYRSAGSLFRHFVKSLERSERFPGVRVVRLSSDKATWQDYLLARRHFPNAQVISSMGATEAGIIAWTTLSDDDVGTTGPLPVGKTAPGVELSIVDETGMSCPPGVIGRINIKARHLAKGYWRDPQTTARAFSVDPDGVRVFHTNDLGSLTEDDLLVLAGRRDTTVKIRGQRTDLSEVETALSRLPGVLAVAAATTARADGELQLVAYVVPAAGTPPSARRLRAIARGVLPRNMVPSAFVFVDKLPLAANGKIDRTRLGEMPLPQRRQNGARVKGETEVLLASIWNEAFDSDGVGRDDDFFDLGGDSLVAAVVSARIASQREIEVSFADFVDHPTLREMAAFVDQGGARRYAGSEVPLAPVVRDGPVSLSPLQTLFWQWSRNPAYSRRYTRAEAVRIDGPLDVDVLRETLN